MENHEATEILKKEFKRLAMVRAEAVRNMLETERLSLAALSGQPPSRRNDLTMATTG